MPPMVCRLRLRAGEPLGLSIYPRPTFLSLPLEVRNEIYGLLLVSPDPLTVYPPPSAQLRFRSFTPGLLLLNRSVAAEAAALLYERNTFKFDEAGAIDIADENTPTDCWDALYSFLLLIGARNRANLRHLEAAISRPKVVSVDAQGSVSSLAAEAWGFGWLREVHARDPYARTYPPVREEREIGECVDYISPAIEAVFRLLGPEGRSVRLTLLMKDLSLPLLTISGEGRLRGWSGEVPNLIEILRRRFTCGPDGEPRVEVLWKGQYYTTQFMMRSKALTTDGWDILEVSDIYGPLRSRAALPSSYITLRRRSTACNRPPAFYRSGPHIYGQ